MILEQKKRPPPQNRDDDLFRKDNRDNILRVSAYSIAHFKTLSSGKNKKIFFAFWY